MATPTYGNVLREVARIYTRGQRTVADCNGTTPTHCHLLTELQRSGPLPLSELGTRVSLEKSWVSRAVENMVQRGLVNKEPNPTDARSWLVTLTAEGERKVRELNGILDTHAAQMLGRLCERDRATVEKSLQILLSALQHDTTMPCLGVESPPSQNAAPRSF